MEKVPHIDPAPYWLRAAPLEAPAEGSLPARADVVVVGAGFTGLSAGLALARAGRDVLIVDAEAPGAGASTRNAGMIGWGHRTTVAKLARRYGEAAALDILREAPRALDFTLEMIEREGIACEFHHYGRFLAAASPKHYEMLAREVESDAPRIGMEIEVVPRAEQDAEIVTDSYFGGLRLPRHGGLHPGLLHAGMLRAARAAGARVEGGAPVTAIIRNAERWRIETPRGAVSAVDVAFAANGYAGAYGRPFAAFAQRVIPIPSYLIATDPLGAARIDALMPAARMYVDTRSTHSYFRPSPDGRRILWGGRASLLPLPMEEAARRLRSHMLSIFPSLRDVEIAHCWTGNIAYTRDAIPHLGCFDGVWCAGGYCGSGVAMAPYLGWRLAHKILGGPEAATAFDATVFQRTPFYNGKPWFMIAVEAWHKWKDHRDGVVAIPD